MNDEQKPIIEKKDNSIEPQKIEKKENSTLKQIDWIKKEVIKNNWLLWFMELFEKSPLFEAKTLNKWEILFNEWDKDNNLYIVKKWLLSIEMFTSNLKDDTKQLAILKSGDFLWEWAFSKKQVPKEVSVKAIEETQILKINAKDEIKRFIEENPVVWYELLRHMIVEWNKRLTEANKLLATSYEIEKTINSLKSIDFKAIFSVIDKIKSVVDVDYILYLDKHPIIENFLILKYDSRIKWKLQDLVFEKEWNFLDLDALYTACNIPLTDYIIINKVNIWSEVFWYLIIWREKRSFLWSDKKVFSSASNSFAWIIKKFLSDKDDKNRLYISEMNK